MSLNTFPDDALPVMVEHDYCPDLYDYPGIRLGYNTSKESMLIRFLSTPRQQ